MPAFANAARTYSVAPSRAQNGQLDWLNVSDLPPAVASQVVNLLPGQVTGPIPVQGGIAIFQLRQLQETEARAPSDVILDFAQLFIAGGRNSAALAEASKISARIDTCDDLYGIIANKPEEDLLRDVLSISALPADIALELAKLDNNEVSVALTRNNGETLVFLMLCNRTRALAEDISREDIRTQLQNQRLVSFADIYLQELLADAHIEKYAP